MKTILIHLAMLLSLIFAGCKDLIEENIENKLILVKAPSDGLTSEIYAQQFWWEEMDGATQYRLEIVNPRFDSVVSIILDTLTRANKFTKTLNPGSYQWRIRGENGSYQSKFQTYSFTINPSALNKQTVSRLAPLNNVYQKKETMNFSWTPLFGTALYEIEIYSSAGTLVKQDAVSLPEYSYTFTDEGDYKWRVRATNGSDQTPWTSSWDMGYYYSTPDAPTLSAPAEAATEINPVLFSWNAVPKAKSYTLYINEETINGTLTIHKDIEDLSKQINLPTTSTKVFYWRVSYTDKAGNLSAISTPRKLTIQ